MKTLAARSNNTALPAAYRRSMAHKLLLACGILSSLIYIAANILGAMRWKGYSTLHHTVSELSAIDAPSRPLMVSLNITYSILVIAFGFGVWMSAGRKRVMRILAGLLIGYGAACITGPFTPMHLREVLAKGGATLTDTLHIASAMVDSIFIFLMSGFGAFALGKRFRVYSILMILVYLVDGILMNGPQVATNIAANLPTPWAGAMERILIYGFMLWAGVLSAALLRKQPDHTSH